jgi:hypothetical protein
VRGEVSSSGEGVNESQNSHRGPAPWQLEWERLPPTGWRENDETYTLFRRTLGSEGVPPIPPHMEFLIDRQG